MRNKILSSSIFWIKVSLTLDSNNKILGRILNLSLGSVPTQSNAMEKIAYIVQKQIAIMLKYDNEHNEVLTLQIFILIIPKSEKVC